MSDQDSTPGLQGASADQPVKRRVGRPRKTDVAVPSEEAPKPRRVTVRRVSAKVKMEPDASQGSADGAAFEEAVEPKRKAPVRVRKVTVEAQFSHEQSSQEEPQPSPRHDADDDDVKLPAFRVVKEDIPDDQVRRYTHNQQRQDEPVHPRPKNGFRPKQGRMGMRYPNRQDQQGQGGNGRVHLRDRRGKQQRPNKQQHQEPSVPLEMGPPELVEGLLEIAPKGYGFLRTQETGFEQRNEAIYFSNEIIKRYSLRHAVWVHAMARRHAKGGQIMEILKINGLPVEEAKRLPHFDELKAVNPTKRITFETTEHRYTTRTLDIVAPVARGQRGLIVSPPRAGKTTMLQHMAEAVRDNYSDSLHLMVMLIDERPEEVTEFKRTLPEAEIYASSNDGKVREHCRLAELCIERAKRLVEAGKHVFLLMDSITRLARAYNNADKGSGRTMSGGIDARALEMPRRLFAAARDTRNAGSLTIVATALVETNSRMDDLIFQEFKGTGNMELVLNRRIAENYIFPAVDVLKSGTRREELILPETWLYKIHLIRRALAGHKPVEAMERMLFILKKYPTNTQMILALKQR